MIMAKRKKSYSVSELETLLQKRMSHLENLIERRKMLQSQIAGLDHEIKSVAGASGNPGAKSKLVAKPKRKATRKRAKNKVSLGDVIKEVLSASKSGLSAADIEKAVFATGYKTNSNKFRPMIYQALGKDESIVRNDKTKCYKLKK
jgi:hypothetical protein